MLRLFDPPSNPPKPPADITSFLVPCASPTLPPSNEWRARGLGEGAADEPTAGDAGVASTKSNDV